MRTNISSAVLIGLAAALLATAPVPAMGQSDKPAFTSPINGDKLGPGEEASFNDLVALYDKKMAAFHALQVARKCGSKADEEAAYKKWGEASDAYDAAENQYVHDFSKYLYPPGPISTWPSQQVHDELHLANPKETYLDEMAKVDWRVRKASKYVWVEITDCPRMPSETPPPPKPHPDAPKADIAPEHSMAPGAGQNSEYAIKPNVYWGDQFGLVASKLSMNFDHWSPSSGATGNQFGFDAAGLFNLKGDQTRAGAWAAQLNLSYHNVWVDTPGIPSLNNVTVGSSLIYKPSIDLRVGGTFGYNSYSQGNFNANTYNYGGLIQWWPSDRVAIDGHVGGFNTNFDNGVFTGSNDGYYLGGSGTWYPLHRLAVTGGIDYYHWGQGGGSSETQYSIMLEKLFWYGDDDDCWPPPTSAYIKYTYYDFAPGNFHVNGISFGLNIYTDQIFPGTADDEHKHGTLNLNEQKRFGVIDGFNYVSLQSRF